MSTTLVVGHINPDTDTICAAIAHAWFLNETGHEAEAITSGSLNKETAYVLGRFNIPTPTLRQSFKEGDSLVIVDTNNPEELLPGFEEATITQIIDHHKLAGGISTPDPISITIRPVACTCTILLEIMQAASVTPTPAIAGIMLSSIISDTLKFTSPTTTDTDRNAAETLKAICGIDTDDLAEGLFTAKSDLSGMEAADLLVIDSKIFTLKGKKIRISVLETTKPANAIAMKEALVSAARDMKSREEIDAVFLYVVDILNSNAELIMPDEFEQEIAARAYNTDVTGDTVLLPGIVSRKKQMVPNLEAALS